MIDVLGEDPTLHSTDVASFLRDNMATSTLVTLREGTTGVSEEILRCCDDVTYVEMSAGGAVEALQRHALVVIELRMTDDAGLRRAIVHGGVQYVERGGSMLIVHDDALPSDCGLGSSDLVGAARLAIADRRATVFRRGPRTTVHDLLFEARSVIRRVDPVVLHNRLDQPDRPLVVDTRTTTDRSRFGVIDPSIHVPRTVLEWHLDPANGYLHPSVTSFDQPIVVVCNGGYSSSIGAANLVRLGYTDVADLIGGLHAWRARGLPVHNPDHSHLDW